MARCGRKKGTKNKQKGIPTNFGFWVNILRNKKYLEDFISRGDKRQKSEIRYTLNYARKFEPEIFEELTGKDILRRMK